MSNYLVLRLLMVGVRTGGQLVFGNREGAIRPIDESWWDEVLHDPRARVPTEHYIDQDDRRYAHYRLDRQAPDFLAFGVPADGRNLSTATSSFPDRREHECDLSGARMDTVPRAKQDGGLMQGLCVAMNPRQLQKNKAQHHGGANRQ